MRLHSNQLAVATTVLTLAAGGGVAWACGPGGPDGSGTSGTTTSGTTTTATSTTTSVTGTARDNARRQAAVKRHKRHSRKA